MASSGDGLAAVGPQPGSMETMQLEINQMQAERQAERQTFQTERQAIMAEGQRVTDDNHRITQENQQLRTQVNGQQEHINRLETGFDQVRQARAEQQQLAYKYADKCGTYGHDGKKSWTVFLAERQDWLDLYRIGNTLEEDWHKHHLISRLRGVAREMVTGMEVTLKAMRLTDMVQALENLYQPPAESELTKQQFKEKKQGKKEDMIRYLSAKNALYKRGWPDVKDQNVRTLIEEAIEGMYSNEVKGEMFRYFHDPSKPLSTFQAVHQHAISVCAAERKKVKLGISAANNYDGLAATSAVNNSDSLFGVPDDAMDISRMGDKKCFNCGSTGHLRNKCPKPKKSQPKGGKQEGKTAFKGECNRCKRTGHMKKDCHAKKTADGKDLPPVGTKPKVRQINDDTEIVDIESGDSDE